MASKKNSPRLSPTRLKNLEQNLQTLSFSTPQEILDWEAKLTLKELRAAYEYRLAPEKDKEGMVDPGDALFSRLPPSAFDWAESTAKVVRKMFPNVAANELPTWALVALVLSERRARY